MPFTPDRTKPAAEQLVTALEYLIGTVVDGTRPAKEQAVTATEYLVYLLETASSGRVDWQELVLSALNLVTTEPASPTNGDRYLNTATGASSVTSQSVTANRIYEWDSAGTSWLETVPNAGTMVYNEATTDLLGFTGSAWVTMGSFANYATLVNGSNADALHVHAAAGISAGTLTNAKLANMAARTVKVNTTNDAAAPTDLVLGAYQSLRGNAGATAIEAKEQRVFEYTITAGDVIAQAATIPFGFTAVAAHLEYRVATTGAQVVDFTRVNAAPKASTVITAGTTPFIAGDIVTVAVSA